MRPFFNVGLSIRIKGFKFGSSILVVRRVFEKDSLGVAPLEQAHNLLSQVRGHEHRMIAIGHAYGFVPTQSGIAFFCLGVSLFASVRRTHMNMASDAIPDGCPTLLVCPWSPVVAIRNSCGPTSWIAFRPCKMNWDWTSMDGRWNC
jgi:hypothetical protein